MMQRLVMATISAAAVTLALLFLMNALSWLQPGAMAEPRERQVLDFVRVKPDETVDTLTHALPDRPPRPPTTPPPPTQARTDGEAIEVPIADPPNPVSGKGTFGLSLGDGPLVALVRVAPNYPAREITRGIEGYAIVEFTVLADGSTAAHRIVESSHSAFEAPAIRAAERFRYKPKVVDGVPQSTPGVRNVFRFKIDRT